MVHHLHHSEVRALASPRVIPPVDRLYIAAKAPRPGLAKTRLARGIGEEAALALYRGFLSDLAARFLGSGDWSPSL